jgi:hypothetical protein
MPTTALNESVEQVQDLSPPQRSRATSHATASLKQSPKPFESVSKATEKAFSRPDHRSLSNVSKSFHQLEVHVGNKRPANKEDVDGSLEDNVIDDDEEGEEEQETEEIYGLKEAKAVYSHRKPPDFVIQRPGNGLARKVAFRPRKKRDQSLINGKLAFEFWNEDETRGFWTLTDDEGYKWIVKYFASSQEYRAWTGIESGYDDKGLAFSRKHGHGSEYRRIASQSTVSGDSEESDHDQIETGRSFRKRNIDQIHPYSTEKTNYKRSKDGKKKQNFKRQYTSDREISGPRSSTKMRRPNRSNGVSRMEPTSQRSSAQIKPSSKSRLASGSVERKVTPPPSPEPASLEMIQNSTTLYIFTNSDFEAPPVPIYLKSCKDVDSFFSIMLLVAGVQERDIRLITIKFDWLPESKPNTIQMIRGLSDSYDKMMEEIRGAPAWERGGGGKVDVSINVVLK